MITQHVHISRGVTKLGTNMPSVSLPPVLTCREDAPCFSRCYARRGRFAFPHNKSLLQTNLDIWNEDPVAFERDVIIAAFPSRFFRWHSAGDIPDLRYLGMMARVAQSIPETRFLCFTKKHELVNEYIAAYGELPGNLIIVFSAWGDFLPDNPYNLPVAYVRFRNQQTSIPASAFQCPNYCGECVATGCSCWDLKPGQSVCFNEH